MSDPRYRFITTNDSGRLRAAASVIVGRRIVGVHCYEHDWDRPADWLGPEVTPPHTRPILGPRRDAHGHAYHQLDDALVLGLDDGTELEIGGVCPGFSWGIDVHHGPPLPAIEGRIITDASTSGAWRSLLYRPILAVRVAWKQNDYGEPDSVWALGLEFGGSEMVIATLGEDYDGTLRPHPSSLVALFDVDLAKEHGMPDADAALGTVIAALGAG